MEVPHDDHRADEDLAGELPEAVGGSSGWVTTKVAAAALGVAPRTVRDYVARGELAARREGEGVQKTLYISIDSLQELRARRGAAASGGAAGEDLRQVLASELISRGEDAASAAAGAAADQGSPADVEVLRELLLRLEARSAEAGELRARLQLTERAESTLREALARERERADRERERAELLEAEVSDLRGRSWWRRLFGR